MKQSSNEISDLQRTQRLNGQNEVQGFPKKHCQDEITIISISEQQ